METPYDDEDPRPVVVDEERGLLWSRTVDDLLRKAVDMAFRDQGHDVRRVLVK